VRGDGLKRDLEVVSLKPNRVAIVEEPYASARASMAQVRRFADLFTATNLIGGVAAKKPKPSNSWLCDSTDKQKLSSLTPSKIKNAGTKSGGMWEEPLLDEFYSYFSFGDVPGPAADVRVVRVAEGEEENGQEREPSSFSMEVEVRGHEGRTYRVAASPGGFSLADGEKKEEACHGTLVELMREASPEDFGPRYAALMAGFKGRNQFGNPPLGLRCNTWAVPPCLSEQPERRTVLPTENVAYQGDNGGILSDRERDWHGEFVRNAAMPGSNPAERVARDHKVFLLHSHFVDTAIITACGRPVAPEAKAEGEGEREEAVHKAKNLSIRAKREPSVLSADCGSSTKMSNEERFTKSEAALVKGLLADENTIARDVAALGRVQIHFNGRSIQVEADEAAPEPAEAWPADQEPALQQTSALNVHCLREFFHADAASFEKGASHAELAEILGEAVFEEDLTPPKLRWEIVFSWMQHLKNPPTEGPGSLPVKYGLNRRLLLGKESRSSGTKEGEAELRAKLGEEDWNQLAKLNIGLHRKEVVQLMAECNRYYAEIALPRIIHDFGSLELSPIDGQTLTDFMHSRGINVRHIGRLAILSKSLMHIHSLCIQEMVVRAAKRVFRVIMSKCADMSDKAAALAGSLNALLGSEGSACGSELWDWIHRFVKKRFDFELAANVRSEIRHVALLRDLCQRVGIEITSRSYDFCSEAPFAPKDIVAAIPVCKHIQFTSADGRQLLEQAKAALDKGKLDEAVTTSTSALSKMCAVCGSHSHATANAFSLLAVVLYHTGDFLQAAIYQQKALAVNEREYGLDHPDTIKSYGDLAVFFYRLQHTELALHYVSRALYLLHLTCGADHPNTAATYINVAMMEESLDNVHVALRYLQEALHCNQKLLGIDHVQTAASYHAIAIALSLMDPPLYMLSVQHEQTTLDILEQKLGPDDIRTQDAAAWLEYFSCKAEEGSSSPDCNIASKGHLPVKELMKEFFEEEEGEESAAAGPKKKKEKKEKRERKKASPTSSVTPNSVLSEVSCSSLEDEEEQREADVAEEEEDEMTKTWGDVEPLDDSAHATSNAASAMNGVETSQARDEGQREKAEASSEEEPGEWVSVNRRKKKKSKPPQKRERQRSRHQQQPPARPAGHPPQPRHQEPPTINPEHFPAPTRAQPHSPRAQLPKAPQATAAPAKATQQAAHGLEAVVSSMATGTGGSAKQWDLKGIPASIGRKLSAEADAFVPTNRPVLLKKTDFNLSAKAFVPRRHFFKSMATKAEPQKV